MANGRRRFLLAYDIRDDARLRRVHKIAKAYGWPMQYSVFICDLDRIEILQLYTELGDVIHHHADSIAIIDLGEPQERGRKCFEFMGVAPRLPTSGPVVI
jgi:CRISPR-associated protein Cas2